MSRRRAARALKHGSLWIYRLSLYSLLASVLLVGGGMLSVRYLLLPNIDQYTGQISQAISRAARQRIDIGAIRGDWDGLRPRLELQNVRLYDQQGQERLVLDSVDSTLSWASLLALEPRFYSIDLSGLSFEVRRNAAGGLLIAGIPLRGGGDDDEGLADWLLRQHRVALHDSRITWVDEALGGTPLELEQVELVVDRRFRRNRFALRAVPPLEVASPVDLRGDLGGGTLRELRAWTGRLYFAVGYADLAALRQWVALPVQIERGAGGMQVWIDVQGGGVRGVTADVGLSDVRTRLRADLSQLELERLQGRLAWETRPGRWAFSADGLNFTTPDGLVLAPADIRYVRSGREADADALYEVAFDTLDVAAVTRLVDRLPVDDTLRARLAELQPRGTVADFRLSWRGSIQDRGEYAIKGSFDNLAVRPSGYIPGVAAVSGMLDANQNGGSLTLRAGASTLDMPRVFVEPLPLDRLNARVAWTMPDGRPLVRLESVTFSNAHLEGSVAGSYQAQAEGPGRVDLAGGLARVQGAESWRYIPLLVHQHVRDWLQASILDGQLRDVRYTLHGELQRFPFRDDASGIFEVVGKVESGTLAYTPGWPALEDIGGQLAVRGHRLTVKLDAGRVLGAGIGPATAVIPDLGSPEPVLQVEGVGEGPTAEFLRFIAQSPLDQRLGGFAGDLQAGGRGRLALSLRVPLKHSVDTQVSGRYSFADNILVAGPGVPRLEQLGGVLSFSQDDVRLREGRVRVLGMPAQFTLDRQPGVGIVVRGSGRAEMARLRQELGLDWMAHLAGTTGWAATVTLGGGNYDLVLESDLRGVSSSLPPPLSKPAGQTLALRLERTPRGADQDLVAFTAGGVLSGQLAYRRGGVGQLTQGELRLGAQAPAPQRDGLWLAGELDYLDLDRWFAVLGGSGREERSALAGVELRAGRLYAFSRDWAGVLLESRRAQGAWQASIAGREVTGTLAWAPGGQGSLTGRFSRLFVPAAAAVVQAPGGSDADRDLPSLDVIADEFRLGQRQFGRLVLRAVPQGKDWRIETLDLRSPEGRLSMSGVWQAWNADPLTRMDVRAEVGDIGGYFARLKLPEGVEGGSGRLEGQLSWRGPPYALDLPSLSGKLTVQAQRGQFVRVEPGIGKLIGVLSLQALPRRMTLDFRDVFSEGFPFDEIRSTASIQGGVATTDNFRMTGTSARIDMRGDLDLVKETQALTVKVVPSLSEGVALGAAIVNPAVGLATLFAQKALKDPINQIISFEYTVTGTWADPVVASKRREPVGEEKQGRQ